MARTIATNTPVGRAELEAFIRPRHNGILTTTRRNGRPQMSPVTMGLDAEGRIVVASYPDRAKAINAQRNPTRLRLRVIRRFWWRMGAS